jgi:hypothetical protein
VEPLVGRRRAAQVAAGLLAFALCAGAWAHGPERKLEWTCAGDGNPTSPLALSALIEGQGVWAQHAAALVNGDASDGSGVALRAARLELCGRWDTRRGRVWYRLGYEPWNVTERATPGAMPWGKLLSAEVGWAPWSWLGFYFGVRKLDFLFGHDEPEQALILPLRPYITTSVAPDRRWGVTIDDDFGVAHITLGLYEGAQDLKPTLESGLLITARLRAEPIGPVGYTLSTVDDDPMWRKRVRFGINASVLLQYTNNFSGYALAADVPIKWGPLGIGAEYVWDSSTPEQGPVRAPVVWSRQGAWAGFALMMLRPCLELAGRYDYMNVPLDPLRTFHAITVGLNGYVWKKYARLQVMYTHKFHDIKDDSLLFVVTLAGSVNAVR